MRGYTFGRTEPDEFRLDLQQRQLYRLGQPINLEPLVYELLLILLRGRGEIIEKKNLLDTIWRGKHNGGSDETLQALVSKLRRALEDSPQKPSYIQTRHGEGYRFIADVQEMTFGEPEAHDQTTDYSSYFAQTEYYDLTVQVHPYLEAMLKEVTKYIPDIAAPSKVLVLGCGTGSSVKIILENSLTSTVFAIEDRKELLKGARQRLIPYGSRVKFQFGHFKSLPFDYGYHLCVSALAIHHLTKNEKIALFPRIYDCLFEGGRFVMIDLVKLCTERLQLIADLDEQARLARLLLEQDWIRRAIRHRDRDDHQETVRDLTQWLREAGFSRAECIFRYYGMAMIYAEKSKKS
jgi:tRNA (cmo5U34)-methyltransferase